MPLKGGMMTESSLDDSSWPPVPAGNSTIDLKYILTFLTAIDKYYIIADINLLLLLLGCFGNAVTIVVLKRSQRRYSATSIYMTALAITDTFILLNSSLGIWLAFRQGIVIASLGPFACKMSMFLIYWSVQSSSWVLVVLTTTRAMKVVCSNNTRVSCSRRTAKVIVVTIWIVLAGINAFVFIEDKGADDTSNVVICGSRPDDSTFLFQVYLALPSIDLLLAFAVPFITILCGNSIIVFHLIRTRRVRFIETKQRSKLTLTLTVVLSNVVFLVTMAPLTLYSIDISSLSYDAKFQSVLNENILVGWFQTLSNSNAVLIFYLYCMNSAKFRANVRRYFCCYFGNMILSHEHDILSIMYT